VSLESSNDDAFCVVNLGAEPGAPRAARRDGSSGVVDRRRVTGWEAQGTWEVLLLPVGEVAGGGMAGVNNTDPGPSSGLQGGGSAEADTNAQAPAEPAGKAISRRTRGAGSRSAPMVPPKAGNRGHRDPLEGSGASHVQSH